MGIKEKRENTLNCSPNNEGQTPSHEKSENQCCHGHSDFIVATAIRNVNIKKRKNASSTLPAVTMPSKIGGVEVEGP
jgi:hypothetical protein